MLFMLQYASLRTLIIGIFSSQVFNDDEVFKLTRYLNEHPTIHNLELLLLFETGMRVGELCVLKPENIIKEGILINATEIYKEQGMRESNSRQRFWRPLLNYRRTLILRRF